jgi:hypothetical protein
LPHFWTRLRGIARLRDVRHWKTISPGGGSPPLASDFALKMS